MKHKAQYSSKTFLTLNLGQRKQSPYANLLYIRDGKILLRLGRNELMLKKGDTFYLPFDCLFQITAMQGAQLDTLEISPRLKGTNTFPHTSGKVTTSLLIPLIQTLYESKHNQSRTQTQELHLIDVLLDELLHAIPKQIQAPIIETNEIKEQLQCRGIIRQVKSGNKIEALIQNKPELKAIIKQYTDLLK